MSTGINVDGLAEFERTTSSAVHALEQLSDAHKAAGEVLVNRTQPRTPAVASGVAYAVEDGVTTLAGDVIYVGRDDDTLTGTEQAEIVQAFTDEIAHIVSTIHGT